MGHGAKNRNGTKVAGDNEQNLHLRLAELLRRSPNHNVRWWHTPNQGNFPVQYRVKLKRMGVMAGIPDFFFVKPTPPELFALELKTEKGRASPEQLDWRDYFRDIGWYAEIVYGWDQAIRVLGAWGIIKVKEVV